MLLRGGAKLINLEAARSSFQASPFAQRVVYLPLRIEVDKAATLAKRATPEGEQKRVVILKGYASTPTLDSQGHVVALSAWNEPRALARYQKNPVVLYQHDADFPVGTAALAEPDSQGLYVELEISGAAKVKTGEPLGDLLDDGRLRTLSVGIRVLDFDIIEAGDSIYPVITRLELFEISIVSIPANEDAIFEVSKGIEAILSKSLNISKSGGVMDLKLIAKALGLNPETATELEIMTAVNRMLSISGSAKAVRKALGLGDDASDEDISKALADRDPAKFEKIALENRKLKARELVSKHSKKVSPALRDWAEAYAEKDAEGFEAWASKAPEAVPTAPVLGGDHSKGGAGSSATVPPSSGSSITKEDAEVCAQFGAFDTVEDMEKMANIKPNEALSMIFNGRKFALTAYDQETLREREHRERLS